MDRAKFQTIKKCVVKNKSVCPSLAVSDPSAITVTSFLENHFKVVSTYASICIHKHIFFKRHKFYIYIYVIPF